MNYDEGQALTLRWLGEAGLAPGMRVLDAGCGPGNLARLVFARIGDAGSLVGVDTDEAYLAQARAQHAGRDATFVRADLNGPLPDGLGVFDAIVARRVLLYLADPGACLRRLRPLLRPGGILFVQEFVLFDHPTALPLHDRVRGWMQRMLDREGAPWQLGRELPRLFAEAGLPCPVIRAEADVAAPGQPDSLVDRIRFVLPRLIEAGIPAAEIDVDTLGDRLRAERDGLGQAWFGELVVAGWATAG
ncbi:MAG: methyltransferase domain-containing protein [Myxococcota bacterium]